MTLRRATRSQTASTAAAASVHTSTVSVSTSDGSTSTARGRRGKAVKGNSVAPAPVTSRKRKAAEDGVEDNGTLADLSKSRVSRKKKNAKEAADAVEPVASKPETKKAKRSKTADNSSSSIKKAKVTTSKKTTKKKVTSSAAVAPLPSPSSSSSSSSVTIAPPSSLAPFKFGTVSRALEEELHSQGVKVIVGVDEAGRGPLAGPVVAAAVYIPPDVHIEGINDSKQLDEAQREWLYECITSHKDIVWSVVALDHLEIDRINILEATMQAMRRAVEKVDALLKSRSRNGQSIQHVLVDGNRLPKDIIQPAEAVVKGDGNVFSIAAASILAKVTRDREMLEHDKSWPQYGFAQHKGYGVGSHMSAIHKHGPCPIHRMTFAPCKHMKERDAKALKAAMAATSVTHASIARLEASMGMTSATFSATTSSSSSLTSSTASATIEAKTVSVSTPSKKKQQQRSTSTSKRER